MPNSEEADWSGPLGFGVVDPAQIFFERFAVYLEISRAIFFEFVVFVPRVTI